MNLISKIEKYVKRPTLAKMVRTNSTYLSALAKKTNLTPEMEERLRTATKKISEALKNISEGKS